MPGSLLHATMRSLLIIVAAFLLVICGAHGNKKTHPELVRKEYNSITWSEIGNTSTPLHIDPRDIIENDIDPSVLPIGYQGSSLREYAYEQGLPHNERPLPIPEEKEKDDALDFDFFLVVNNRFSIGYDDMHDCWIYLDYDKEGVTGDNRRVAQMCERSDWLFNSRIDPSDLKYMDEIKRLHDGYAYTVWKNPVVKKPSRQRY